ncbi:hypothetical protein QT971_26290 [Microcoleus sp. herbarium19]
MNHLDLLYSATPKKLAFKSAVQIAVEVSKKMELGMGKDMRGEL